MPPTLDRRQVMAYRIHAQQLDRAPAPRPVTDAAIFDIGVQDTGRDGASWALANRGVPLRGPGDLEQSDDVALVWTLRGAPHYYRRAELAAVRTATSPLSEADASKRIFGAAKPLEGASISTLDGLAHLAGQMQRIVTTPLVKGEVSRLLSATLDEPYLRYCVPCNAVHPWEQPFRFAALYAGLELRPGTSPPVLQPIPRWRNRTPGPASRPLGAPPHLQPIRSYLWLFGPSAPADVAAYLDAPISEVKAHWPEDAQQVSVDGTKRWFLPGQDRIEEPAEVRLLGPFDLLIQGRDRHLIVPDADRHKTMWPTLGRPGAILAGTEIVGTWRPRASGRKLTLRYDLWRSVSSGPRTQIEEQAERLAAHRGVTLSRVTS